MEINENISEIPVDKNEHYHAVKGIMFGLLFSMPTWMAIAYCLFNASK